MSGNTSRELNTLKLSVKNQATNRTPVAKNNANAVKLKVISAKSVSIARGTTLITPRCRPVSSSQKTIVQTENKCGSISNCKKPNVPIKRAQSSQSITNSASKRSRKIESKPAGSLTTRCSSLQAVFAKAIQKENVPEQSTQNKFQSKNCLSERKSKISEVHIESKGAACVKSCLQLHNCLKMGAEEESLSEKLEVSLMPQIESKTSDTGSQLNALSWQPWFSGEHGEPMDVGAEGILCHDDLVRRIETLTMDKMALGEELGRKCGEIIELRTLSSQLTEEKKDTSCMIEHLVSELELARTKCLELETELKETVRRFQLEEQEWKQFKKDLQTAVVVADGFRSETEEELSKVMAQNRELSDRVASLKAELQQAKHDRLQQDFHLTNGNNKSDVFLTAHQKSKISGYLTSDFKTLDIDVQQSSLVTAATLTKLPPSEQEKTFGTRTALSNMTTNLLRSNAQSPGHCCQKLSLFQHSSSPASQKRDTSLESSPKQQFTSTFRWSTDCSASPASRPILVSLSDDVKQAAIDSVFTRANKENFSDNKRLPLADILANKLTESSKKNCLTRTFLR